MKFILTAIMVLFASVLQAEPALVSKNYLVGSGTFNYYLWDVYKASLYSDSRLYDPKGNFVLELHYLLALRGEDIATQSIKEMKVVGCTDPIKLGKWLIRMKELFPDVVPGSRLIGMKFSDGISEFYKENLFLGRVEDSDFTTCFFNIWLDESTSQPDLRMKLLGKK